MIRRAMWCLAIAAVVFTACDTTTSRFEPGLELGVQVSGAQLRRGALGKDEGGPEVSQVLRPQPEVSRGEAGVFLRGRLGPDGVALHIQAADDDAHWVVAPAGFDFVVPDELQWSAELTISYAVLGEVLPIRLQAVGRDGRLGPMTETELTVSPDLPPAPLLVSLGWDAPADVDLAVVDPNGIEISKRNINSFEPPQGQIPNPDDWMQGGWLDYDSNQQCRLDLRNRENVMWLYAAPPPGRYSVYAQLYASCGAPVINLVATAQREGQLIYTATSTLYEFDEREHPRDSDAPGLLLMEFEVAILP